MTDFVVIWLPIIQLVLLVGGAIAGVYKYYEEKNREVYETLLSEVYAPLFQYFVKQELMRKLLLLDDDYKDTPLEDYKETPILEVRLRNETTKIAMTDDIEQNAAPPTTVLDLSRDAFLEVLDIANIGLAPKELYTLLSMYKVATWVCRNKRTDSPSFSESAIIEQKIAHKLRKEIISGYIKYHKKLGLNPGDELEEIVISDDNIVFYFSISEEEINAAMSRIQNDTELFRIN